MASLFALLLALASQDSASWPFGGWQRASENPVISPLGDGRESAASAAVIP
ncbi:MAG TPA: hypothetical protein VFF50_09455 [Candidatus Deferrimicrobiaceae bacterium]|nr:hypothetical protein [Candidatus Deferrimicrobiaceae bacterium]